MNEFDTKYDNRSENMFISQSHPQFTQQQSAALDALVRVEKIVNEFYLPPEITTTLEKYYILHWQGEHLISQMQETQSYQKSTTYLTHQDVKYKVNFLHCSPWELVTQKDKQFKLSFRLQRGAKVGIVIVKKGT